MSKKQSPPAELDLVQEALYKCLGALLDLVRQLQPVGSKPLSPSERHLLDRIEDLHQTVIPLSTGLAQDRINLQNKLQDLTQRYARLEEEKEALRQKYEALLVRFNKATFEHSLGDRSGVEVTNSDVLTTKVSGKFAHFCESRIPVVSRLIHQQMPLQRVAGPSEENRRAIARIDGTLAHHLLNEGRSRLRDLDASSPQTAAQNRSQCVREICAVLAKSVLNRSWNAVDPAITKEIEALAGDAIDLLRAMTAAEPPGEPLFAEEGQPFDAQQHETMPGLPDTGIVAFTVRPGYRMGGRVVSLPTVWVEERADRGLPFTPPARSW